MKRILLLIALHIVTIATMAHSGMSAAYTTSDGQADTLALRRLALFARNMQVYNNLYTQEKVYLHLDNNGYLPGESIWFKAYVFKAASLLPTDLSKVLYVELLNPHGQVVERRILPVENGRTYGDIKLNELVCHPGFYEVRAYTRAMLNWDAASIYSRTLPIYEPPTDSIDFSDLRMPPTEYYTKPTPLVRSTPTPLIDKNTLSHGKRLLTFYPEGGHLTQGNASQVAYKLTDEKGLPVGDTLVVYDKEGNALLRTTPLHLGMGVFSLPDNWAGGYATTTVSSHKFKLPALRPEGCDITVRHNADSGFVVSLLPSMAYADRLLGLSVTCRGQLCYFSDVTPSADNMITIPADRLRRGVHQITLFTPEGEVLSERLAWHTPTHMATANMTFRQNKQSYEAFSPIVLDIILKDGDGQPLRGDFSLSVRDADTDFAPETHGLQTDMLLSSEIKGFVANPDYYFEADDEQHAKALDLLLMVQGWRRYEWREMAGVDTFELRQPAEEGILLCGGVSDTHASRNALGKDGALSVNFLTQTTEGTKTFFAKTDNNGKFALMLPDFYDDASAIVSVTDSRDRRVYTDLSLFRNFSPPIVPYEPMSLIKPITLTDRQLRSVVKEPPVFEWKDTIPDLVSKVIKLNTVNIRQKKVNYGYRPGIREVWKGEEAVKSHATYYYNLADELDRYMDQGESVPLVWDWLATVNPNFEYYPGDNEKFYHGRKAHVIIDQDMTENGRLSTEGQLTMLLNEFRSMMIVEDLEAARNLSLYSTGNDSHYYNNGAVIYLFTRDRTKEIPYYRRGTRWLSLHGYSRCNDFYSPDYRQSEVPTATDHRRTLYWAPSLTTDAKGKASVLFYSNSRPLQRISINAQGIATNGQMFEAR